MFLSRQQIESRKADLFPELGQFNAGRLSEASYDLSVGDEVFLSEKRIPTRLSTKSPYLVLPPGQFALVKTFEKVSIPRNLIGLISIKSRFKFQGLINISGFHVDPTYAGHLIFAVQNVGPNDIRLKHREPVFMIMFAELHEYSGEARKPGYDTIQLDQMSQLGGPSITLAQLKGNLDKLTLALKIYGAIATAILLTLISLFLAKLGR